MNDGTMLFRTNSSICQVVVIRYFEASKIVRSRGMRQMGTDRSVEAGAGMETIAGTANHELLLPAVQGLLAYTHLATHLYHGNAHLHLLQHRDNLFYGKTLPLHGKSPFPSLDFAGN
jgi:hypothetical protein